MIVADASAVLDGLLAPATRPELVSALAGATEDVAAPDLLDVEVQRVLRRWERHRRITPARASQALDDLAALPIARYPARTLTQGAWALRHRLTASAAQYVALAQAAPARLLTTDGRMSRVARDLGVTTSPAGARRRTLSRGDVRLSYLEFGGAGPPALLLHGLAGHAGEWAETASWLTGRARVFALDMRGHGHSERRLDDVSRAAHVADVAAVVQDIGEGPVVLVGQSLGGHTAFLVAAERPDLVRALAVAEASPAAGGPEAGAEVRRALAAWPIPFRARADAIRFFGGPSVLADAWADGLEPREDGLWPRFDIETLVAILREAVAHDHWAQWTAIRCPALVVRAGRGTLAAATARQMLDRLAHARLVEIPDAAHDVHLDRPAEWRATLGAFLDACAQSGVW